VEDGFYSCFDEIFQNKNQIYEGQDIFYGGRDQRFVDVIYRLEQSLKRMSKQAQYTQFHNYNTRDHLWNLYALPFEGDTMTNLQTAMKGLIKKNQDIDWAQFDLNPITQGVFISLVNVHSLKKKTLGGPDDSSKRNPAALLNSLSIVTKLYMRVKHQRTFSLPRADRNRNSL
jgi:hypothetical protein